MSCWVLPTVAAELWGVSIDDVLGRARAGTIRSKVEAGLTLIDVAPAAVPAPPARRRVRSRRKPRTYVPVVPDVTDAELQALHGAPTPAGDAPADERALADESAETGPVLLSRRARVVDAEPPAALTAEALREEEAEMGPAGDPDPDTDPVYPDEGPPLHWQKVRARVSRTRKPPGGR